MLARIDILYPHLMHIGGQFPPAPATLFQAFVAANGHRLDSVKDVLETMENSSCVRIVQHCEASPINIRVSLPRLPKPQEIKDFKFGDAANKVLEHQTVFPLDDASVHLSYYFEMPQTFTQDRLSDVLRVNVLGRGESVCMSRVSVSDRLNDCESGTVWEQSESGRHLNVPYAGFLHNLRLYHDAKKSSLKVPQRPVPFAVKGSVAPYTPICYSLLDENGDTFSYRQEAMSDISAMMRHAVMTALKGKCDAAYLSGHTDVHPFYLPAPTIGSEYADGDIRRVIIAEPTGQKILMKNLSSITSLSLINDKFVCQAVRETDPDFVFDQYLKPTQRFRTVTPMILDRAGGQQRVGKRIEALIMKAGFPRPTNITFNKTWWNGKLPVSVARAVVHAEVEFPVAVAGPFVAGLGSGYGIGLFAQIGG
jgi:CRISPR-associated protein Csb2